MTSPQDHYVPPAEVLPVMEVQRVRDDNGTHIEPPLDDTWPQSKKLSWHAGVIVADTGLDVSLRRVPDGCRPSGRVEDAYTVSIRDGSSSGGYDFYEAWAWLNGVSSGARAVSAASRHS